MINWIDDKWIGTDKIGHFLLHFVVGFSYTKFLNDSIGGIIFSEWFGCFYEYYDSVRGTGASWKDLIANNLGMVTGVIWGVIL